MADKKDYPDLRSIMDTLSDGSVCHVREAEFLMQGPGGLGQPDVVSFVGRRYVGIDEENEKKLWDYINALPDKFKREISVWYGYLKDEYKPKGKGELL